MALSIRSSSRYLKSSDHTCEWKIEDFDNRMRRENKTIVSPEFAIPGQEGKFFLRVEEAKKDLTSRSPNENQMETPNQLFLGGSYIAIKWYFSVSLALEGGDKSTKVAATLVITKGEEVMKQPKEVSVMKGSIGETHSFVGLQYPQTFVGTTGARYYRKQRSSLVSSNFYTMGETSLLTLRATITTPSQPITSLEAEVEDDKHCNFRPLLTDPKYADINLKCQGRVFPCHRVILSSRSSVFERMFDSNMAEAKSGTVVIEDMEADTLQRLLEFTYSCKVTDMQEVMELLYAADKYQMPDLVRECAGHLQEELTPATTADILVLSDRQVVIKRILSAKARFMGDAEFQKKMKKEPELLLKLLASD